MAVGAAYAVARYANTEHAVRRVVIFDFDVHHGNGTEAIVRNLQPTAVQVHGQLPVGRYEITQSSFKPWLDASDGDSTMFVSLHGYGKRDPAAAEKEERESQGTTAAGKAGGTVSGTESAGAMVESKTDGGEE